MGGDRGGGGGGKDTGDKCFIPQDEKTKRNSDAKIRGKPPIRKRLAVVITQLKTVQLETFLASLQDKHLFQSHLRVPHV